MTVTLRRAVPGDAGAMLALEALFPTDRMPMRGIRHLLRSTSACVWVAAQGDTCVGNLVLLLRRGSRVARIYSLVVAPQARGQGIAQSLVERAEHEARNRGCDRVRLEVREDNAAARALYARLGYQVWRALPDYYEDGGAGLRLQRRLKD